MLPCRSVTLRSNYTVSERDTPIQYSVNHLLSPLINSLTIFHQVFFIPGISSIERVQDYKFHGLTISGPTNHKTKLHNRTIKYIEYYTISFNTY